MRLLWLSLFVQFLLDVVDVIGLGLPSGVNCCCSFNTYPFQQAFQEGHTAAFNIWKQRRFTSFTAKG
jgi:hypothetical protein